MYYAMGCRLCQNTKQDIYKNAGCLRKSPGILSAYHVIYIIGHEICAIGLGILNFVANYVNNMVSRQDAWRFT